MGAASGHPSFSRFAQAAGHASESVMTGGLGVILPELLLHVEAVNNVKNAHAMMPFRHLVMVSPELIVFCVQDIVYADQRQTFVTMKAFEHDWPFSLDESLDSKDMAR